VVPDVRPIRNVASGPRRPAPPETPPGWAEPSAQRLDNIRPAALRPRGIQDGALAPAGNAAANSTAKSTELASRQGRDSLRVRDHAGGLRTVAQLGPAEPFSGHDDGGVVGPFIGPTLKVVEKRHRTNFTGRGPCQAARGEDYCDNMSFNDNVELDPIPGGRPARRWSRPRHKVGGGIGGGVVLLLAASSASIRSCSGGWPGHRPGTAAQSTGTPHGLQAGRRRRQGPRLPHCRDREQPQHVLAGLPRRLQREVPAAEGCAVRGRPRNTGCGYGHVRGGPVLLPG
jgi:hypothetical protein